MFQYRNRKEILERLRWAGSFQTLINQQMLDPDSMPDNMTVIKAKQLNAAWDEFLWRCSQMERLLLADDSSSMSGTSSPHQTTTGYSPITTPAAPSTMRFEQPQTS